jgi:RNA polymerase sigma-70 factor (ECF subfamily)
MKTGTTGAEDKRAWFGTTSWTMVENAQGGSKEALEKLCRSYWFPLYAYIRRLGRSPEDAQDLTQGFFYELLEKNYFRAAQRGRGKFRSFLLVSLKYFLENERDQRMAQKRGGGVPLISLDDESAEERYGREPVSDLSPEKLFDRAWARTVLEQVQLRLREEYRAKDKLDLYERLQGFLNEETGARDYDAIATQGQMRPGTVAVAVHRLRHRYRELVREEIARTVASPADVDGELRHFYAALTG